MHLSLSDSEVTLLAIVVSLTLGAVLVLAVWVLRWLWKKFNRLVKVIEIIGRLMIFSLMYWWRLGSTIIVYYSKKIFNVISLK